MSERPDSEDPRSSDPLFDMIVPDDPSALQADIAAYHREQRRRRRRERLTRVLLTRRWYRYGLSGPVVTLCLCAVGVFGLLLAVMGPVPPAPTPARPLAAPTVAPGRVGGLLPSTTLRSGDAVLASSALIRPAVLLLAPQGCDCGGALATVAGQATSFRLPVVLVAAHEASPALTRLAREVSAGQGPVSLVTDPYAVLAGAYAAGDPSVVAVFVRADGVVSDVVRRIVAGSRLTFPLNRLVAAEDTLGADQYAT